MTTPEPLWSDKAIYECMKRNGLGYVTLHDNKRMEVMNGAQIGTAMLEMRNYYEAALTEMRAENARLTALPAEFIAAATAALGWIDEMYPPDIFDGSSGDEGPVRIAAIREALRSALVRSTRALGQP